MYETENWQKERLPVIPITDPNVNFFAQYGVEMAAAAGCATRARTLKLPAAQGVFDGMREHGVLGRAERVAEASSGRMAEAYLCLAPKHGLKPEQFLFIMKEDVPAAKKQIIRFHGGDIEHPPKGHDPIQLARDAGGGGWSEKDETWHVNIDGTVNPDQYATPYVSKYFETWGAESILDGYGEFDILVAPVGTGGTVVGLSRGLRKRLGEKLTVIGAMCGHKEEIPGMRDLERMALIRQPWREAIDQRIDVLRKPSFLTAPWVSRAIRSRSGPSGGAAYVALCIALQEMLDTQGEEALQGKRALFVIHDEATVYVGDRMGEFAQEDFYPPTARPPRELIFGEN